MSREWKPGDLAMVNDTTRPDAPWKVAMCTASARPGVCETRWRIDTGEVWGSVSQVRPLVVLDLAAAAEAADTYNRGNPAKTLRHLADTDGSTPRANFARHIADQIEAQTRSPKPEQPSERGAVVKDSSGLEWVRVHPGGEAWVNGYQRWAAWGDIDAVEVVRP